MPQANSAAQLDNLGSFSLARWRHIKCIHRILPNSDHGQTYVAQTGNDTHFQGGLLLQLLCAGFGGEWPWFYTSPDILSRPGQDYSNQFPLILNQGPTVATFISCVDWPTVQVCIKLPSKSNTATSVNPHQSRQFFYLGYTSSICAHLGTIQVLEFPSQCCWSQEALTTLMWLGAFVLSPI